MAPRANQLEDGWWQLLRSPRAVARNRGKVDRQRVEEPLLCRSRMPESHFIHLVARKEYSRGFSINFYYRIRKLNVNDFDVLELSCMHE